MSEADIPGPKEWDTYRTKCGRGRVEYHEEWSPSLPWASYWDGTAGRHFATLDAARWYFQEKYRTPLLT